MLFRQQFPGPSLGRPILPQLKYAPKKKSNFRHFLKRKPFAPVPSQVDTEFFMAKAGAGFARQWKENVLYFVYPTFLYKKEFPIIRICRRSQYDPGRSWQDLFADSPTGDMRENCKHLFHRYGKRRCVFDFYCNYRYTVY